MVSSKSQPRRSVLRFTLDKKYPTDSELSAFILDHFPNIYRTLSNGLDRNSRISALLEREDVLEELEQLLEIPQTQDINQHEINHIKPAIHIQDYSKQKKITQETINLPEGTIKLDKITGKVGLIFVTRSNLRLRICLTIILGLVASTYIFHTLAKRTQVRTNGTQQCSQCEASCIPELIEEIKDCTALREVILFSETESTVRENIQRAIAHSACTIDAISNQLTTGNVHKCSNQQYRAKLFSLMNIISKSGMISNTSEVSLEYEKACIDRKEWQACIKSGESRKTRLERCEDFRKACQYGFASTKESCIPYFYRDFECPLNGEFTADFRELVLKDLCENTSSSLACYSLGQIVEGNDQCKASSYYLTACMLAKRLPMVCSLLLGDHETEFIGKDCEPSGRWSCEAIKHLATHGSLSNCPDSQNVVNRAKAKINAIGERVAGTNRASR